MSGIELLVESMAEYSVDMVGGLSGSSMMGTAAGVGVKIWLGNMVKKQPYKMILEGFEDEKGNIVNHEELFKAFKDIVKAKPIVIHNIKFTDKDIEQIQDIFESKL